MVCLNTIAQGGGSNLYEPEDFVTFTPEEIQDRIHGSKIVIVSEQAMLTTIYVIKTCMLVMYTRLTLGLRERQLVSYLAIYVALGFIGTELAFFTACRPFKGYWAMPPPDPQCTTLQYYAITQGVFNMSSDAFMLLIPIPLLFRMRVPWRQKWILLIIFGMGIFVITAAILTKVFNLSDLWSPIYMLWYTREASVAVYVSNIPMIWPLLRQWFPFLRQFTPGGMAILDYNSSQVLNGVSLSRNAQFSRMGDGLTNSVRGGKSMTTSRSTEDDMYELKHSVPSIEKLPRHNNVVEVIEGSTSDLGSTTGITKSTTVHVSEEVLTQPGDEFDTENMRSWHPTMHDSVPGGLNLQQHKYNLSLGTMRTSNGSRVGNQRYSNDHSRSTHAGMVDIDEQLKRFGDV